MGVWKPVILIQSRSVQVVLIQTQAVKFRKKFDHFKKSFHFNKKNTLGEYFSFFKSMMVSS